MLKCCGKISFLKKIYFCFYKWNFSLFRNLLKFISYWYKTKNTKVKEFLGKFCCPFTRVLSRFIKILFSGIFTQGSTTTSLACCVLQVFISVSNVNDNVPLSELSVYYPHVPENSPANIPVLQLTASDGDLDPQLALSFRITGGNPESFFTMDSTTG